MTSTPNVGLRRFSTTNIGFEIAIYIIDALPSPQLMIIDNFAKYIE